MKFNCETCGDVNKIIVDGYPFGERLLEGVEFIVTNQPNGLKVKETDECKQYFKQLNQKMWYNECIQYVKDNVGDCVGVCANCGTDILVEK